MPAAKTTVFKPLPVHNNLIILGSDVNYHVVRYVRACTIPRGTLNREDTLAMAIKQTKALLKQLGEEAVGLRGPGH